MVISKDPKKAKIRRIYNKIVQVSALPRKSLNTWKYKCRDYVLSYSRLKNDVSSQKKVSIVIPTLSKGKQEDHLPKLEKLLSKYLPDQYHKNYEAIVWCDGANKKVMDLINGLKDDRIKVYFTETTLGKWGHPQTRLGIDAATGDFFSRINDDNMPYKNYLQSLVSGFDQEIGIVYGRVVYKGEARKMHRRSLADSFVIPGDIKGEVKKDNVDCMCYMVRMDLAKKYRNYWDDEFAADWHFLHALLRDDVKAKFIDRIIGKKF